MTSGGELSGAVGPLHFPEMELGLFYIASVQQKLAGYYQIITRWLSTRTTYKVSPTVITGITQAGIPCLINIEPWNCRLWPCYSIWLPLSLPSRITGSPIDDPAAARLANAGSLSRVLFSPSSCSS